MTNPAPYEFDIHAKYWVDRASGFVPKAETAMKSKDFENFTTQTWEVAEDLELPVPE